ncbi:hypothetical protein, partial [Okeania hirsuta]|uniref:hypothetical protein n=1 Tax=Okeania hirsuta TaxID=1458930 RepID=UPI00195FBAE8
ISNYPYISIVISYQYLCNKKAGFAELKYECVIVWFWSMPPKSPNFGGLLEFYSPQFWQNHTQNQSM